MLVLWLMGAAAYVAAIGVYVTWRLVPACGGAQAPCSAMLLEGNAADVVGVVRWWLLCAAALVPLLALLVYRRLYRPLARLDDGLARVAAGDLTTPILIEHGDELGRLGDQFNAMTLVLQERAEEERRRARRQTERLEEQLFERERLAKPLDVNDLVQDALVRLDVVLTRARVRAHVDADPSQPVVVADRDGLLRVLINLIQNAIDAMPTGGTIAIATARVDPPEASFAAVAIDVIDTGTGIPPEARAKIFDLFFTTKPQGRGTGMGLSIVHEIVKMLGGRIDVTSEVGKGTHMRVLLPAPAVEPHEDLPAFTHADATPRLDT